MALVDDLLGYDTDPDKVEDQMRNGGLAPIGKHHARLDGVRSDTSKEKGTPYHEFTFMIVAGPGAGTEVKENLWGGENAKVKTRRKMFAHRLGLLKIVVGPDGKKAYAKIEGKEEFSDCLGAEVIIDVIHEEYEHKGKKGKKAILAWEGVYRLDDPAATEVAKAAPGEAPTPKKPPVVAGAAQQDWAGLV